MQVQSDEILFSKFVEHIDINVGNALVDVTTLVVNEAQKADPDANSTSR
jgi:hypothetical protein